MSETAYATPETVDAARSRLADGEGHTKVVAGGQSLMLLVRQGFVDADTLVDVSDVQALNGVEVDRETVRLGAATTYSDLAAHDLADRVGMLGDACAVIADPQIRTQGTVGGALGHADPAFDLPPTLCCLDAVVEVGSVDGERAIPIEDFLVGHMTTDCRADELIEAVRFEADPELGTAYEKHAQNGDGWAAVGAAAAVATTDGRVEDVCVALTAVADTAIRSPAVEDALVGESANQDRIEAASERVVEDVDPLDDRSGSAAYKERLAPVIVRRAIERAIERSGGDR